MKINYRLTSAGVSLFLSLHSVLPALAMAETKAGKPQLPIAASSGKDVGSTSPVLPSPGESSSPVLPSPGESSSPVLPSPGSDVSPVAANKEYIEQSQVEKERSTHQAAEQARRQQTEATEQARIQEEQKKVKAAEQARRQQTEATEQARIQEEQRRQSEATRQQNGQPEVRVASSSEPSNDSGKSTRVEPLTKKVKVEQVAFLCEAKNGVPTTIAKDKDNKNVLIIFWKSDFFKGAGYTPQERCKQASSRFELYRKNKSFTYLAAGTINGQPSICLTSKENGTCGDGIQSKQGLLFTLRSNSNPQEILEKLAIALQNKTTSTQQILEE